MVCKSKMQEFPSLCAHLVLRCSPRASAVISKAQHPQYVVVWSRSDASLALLLRALCALDTALPPPLLSPCLLAAQSSPRTGTTDGTVLHTAGAQDCRAEVLLFLWTSQERLVNSSGGRVHRVDIDDHWILRLEAEFGVKVSCDVLPVPFRPRNQWT